MNEREYSHVLDKSDWGDGPWRDEPDKVQWIDEATGFDCLAVRSFNGAWCGYVGVPPGHPAHGADYNSVWPDVHGGLTYADRCDEAASEESGICHVPQPGRPADVWWLGFDCAHAFDIAPGMEARNRASGLPPLQFGGEGYRTLGYVHAQVRSLARQLAL